MAQEATNTVISMNSGLSKYSQLIQVAYEIYGDLNAAGQALSDLESQGYDLDYIDETALLAYKNGDKEYMDALLDSNSAKQKKSRTKTTYESAVAGQKLLKEDMSYDEMSQLHDAFNWGEDGIISWENFYQKSYEEKAAYLKSLSEDYKQASADAAADAVVAARKEKEIADDRANNYVAKNKYEEDLTHEQIVLAAREDAKKDKTYGSLADIVEMDEDGNYGIKSDVDFGNLTSPQRIAYYNFKRWLQENEGKSLTDFITQKQNEGYGSVSQDVIDEFNQITQIAEQAGIDLDDALNNNALWQAIISQVDSVTSSIERLGSAITELPTDDEELRKVADAFGWDMDTLINSTSEERAKRAVEVAEKPTLKHSGEDGTSTDQDYADYEKEMRAWQNLNATGAQVQESAITNNADTIQLLSELEEMDSILSDIDIEELPQRGSKAFDLLEKSLKRVNVDMETFQKMSKTDQLTTIAKAQNSAIQARMQINEKQQAHYKEIMDDTTGKYDADTKLEAESNYYDKVSEYNDMLLQQEQNIANARQQALDIYTKQIDLMEARQATAQEEANKTKNLAQTMSSAVLTGELSKEDMTLFSQEQLADWNDAASKAERGALAANMWAQAATETATSGEELATAYGEAKKNLEDLQSSNRVLQRTSKVHRSGDLDLSKQEDYLAYLKNHGITDEDLLGSIAKAWNNLVAKGDFDTSKLSMSEITDMLETELIEMGVDITKETTLVAAQSRDAILDIYSSLGEEEQKLAEEFVNTWESAFNKITSLRSKILMGESIGEDLVSDFDTFSLYANQYKGGAKGLIKAYQNGTLKADDLSYGSYEQLSTNLRQSAGLQYIHNGWIDFDKIRNDHNLESSTEGAEKFFSSYLPALFKDIDIKELTNGVFDSVDSLSAAFMNINSATHGNALSAIY